MKFKVRIGDAEFVKADPRALAVLPVLERAMWASASVCPDFLVMDASVPREWRSIRADELGLRLVAERDHVYQAAVIEGVLPDTAEAKALVTVLGALAQGHDIAAVFTAMGGPQVSNPAGTR